jgi:hypothetical protein
MGNTVAKNSATEIVNQSIGEMQSVTNQCFATTSLSNEINLVAQNGGTINIGQFNCNQNQYYYLNATCVASSNISSSISSNISQLASQRAQAVSQNVDLNPGSTEAQNLTEAIANSTLAIQNSVYNGCVQAAMAQNLANVVATGPSSSIVVGQLFCSQDAFNQSVSDCVFSSSETASAIENISQSITQAASATVQNALLWVALAIIAIVLFFFLITIEGLTVLLWIFIILFILLLGYLIFAYFKSWWPFHKAGSAPGAGLLTNNVIVKSGTPAKISFTPLSAGSYQVVFAVDPSSPPGTFTWNITNTKTNQAVYTTSVSSTLFPVSNPPAGTQIQVANMQLLSAAIQLSTNTYSLQISTTNSSPLVFSSVAIAPIASATPAPGDWIAAPSLVALRPLVGNVTATTAANFNLSFNGTSATPTVVAPNTTLFVLVNPISATTAPTIIPVTAQNTQSSVIIPTNFALPVGTSVIGIYVPTGSISSGGLSLVSA